MACFSSERENSTLVDSEQVHLLTQTKWLDYFPDRHKEITKECTSVMPKEHDKNKI